MNKQEPLEDRMYTAKEVEELLLKQKKEYEDKIHDETYTGILRGQSAGQGKEAKRVIEKMIELDVSVKVFEHIFDHKRSSEYYVERKAEYWKEHNAH